MGAVQFLRSLGDGARSGRRLEGAQGGEWRQIAHVIREKN
jgi:hypothetical protein